MYWSATEAGKIQRANLDGTGVEDLVSGLTWPRGIVLDLDDSKMYWTDTIAGTIQRANLEGTGLEGPVTGLGDPNDMALDLGADKMYWTNPNEGKIQRANLDGTGVEDLISGLDNPLGIALDLGSDKMYWTDNQAKKIQRADLDGTGIEDLISTWGPDGIALDLGSGKMYWTEPAVTTTIQRANLDGTGVEDVVSGLGNPIGIALSIVHIPDANLRSIIEESLGKAPGAPITPSKMATLTDLNAGNSGIRDLTGLEFATGLTVLNIFGNNITDVSPLSSLPSLAELNLGGNGITDLTFLLGLSNLTQLKELHLHGNNIRDISPLSGLSNLSNLSLYWNSISNLSPLSSLANLERLAIWDNNITDITPLSGLTNLRNLSLGRNSITNISPLSGLINLRNLSLEGNGVTNISPISGLTNLERLFLLSNTITDVSALSGLTNLWTLYLGNNSITEITALSRLTNLERLRLENNRISDIGPLVANNGLGSRHEVDVRGNPLSANSINVHVPALQARGVSVSFDETILFTDPQIYNDNVFVLPVSENLAAGNLPLDKYATRFYEDFSDAFDFLIFFSSLTWSQLEPDAFKGAFHASVGNDIQGIGKSSFFNANWGSAGKLQSGLFFAYVSSSNSEHSRLVRGPMLHELMHRWANFIVQPAVHWDYSSANGILGGFDITTLVDHGGGRYSALNAYTGGWAVNLKPYSPIEMYLAGLIPPEEVPDLWVAADGKLVERDGDRDVFTASQVRTFTIEDIIAEHGARVPDHTQSQKAFRAAVILLVSEDYPAVRQSLDALSNDATLFSYDGEDQDDRWYNFYEATGGRATIAMDGLSQLKSTAAVKLPAVRSFGTPPPPIHSQCECEH